MFHATCSINHRIGFTYTYNKAYELYSMSYSDSANYPVWFQIIWILYKACYTAILARVSNPRKVFKRRTRSKSSYRKTQNLIKEPFRRENWNKSLNFLWVKTCFKSIFIAHFCISCMSCAIFSLDLSNGRCKTMGTTSDILHYHSTFDDTWSLYQYYTESDYLWECEPSVHSICLLDRTSDQAKVSTNFQVATCKQASAGRQHPRSPGISNFLIPSWNSRTEN